MRYLLGVEVAGLGIVSIRDSAETCFGRMKTCGGFGTLGSRLLSAVFVSFALPLALGALDFLERVCFILMIAVQNGYNDLQFPVIERQLSITVHCREGGKVASRLQSFPTKPHSCFTSNQLDPCRTTTDLLTLTTTPCDDIHTTNSSSEQGKRWS